MRPVAVAAVLVLALAAAAEGAPPGPLAVRCESIVRLGGAFAWTPERVVLDVVAVPPAYLPQTAPTGSEPWRFWSKSGLVIRAGSRPVNVSVPSRWRTRVSIAWGDRGGSELRFASCPPTSGLGRRGAWNVYAGGFYLRSRAACVPLVFRVGDRSATVRFGVGERCG
jgi:hypothetical protein